MKKLTLLLLFLSFAFCGEGLAQSRKYLSVGAGLNQSTYYLQPGIFQDGELALLFERPFYLGPELSLRFNVALNEHHTVAASLNLMVYSRVIAAAIPVNLNYYYHFRDQTNTPFLKADAGYSFFLTSGAFYSIGGGYKYGKFRASLNYHNQLNRRSILEENQFLTGRLSSLSLNVEYLFRNNRKGQKRPSRKRSKK